LIVIAAGALLAFGARWLPARTARGALLGRRLHGLSRALAATTASGVPKTEHDLLFSRALPYALALGDVEHWVTGFGELVPYWYDVGGHGARVGEFAAALVGAFAGSRATRTDGRSIQAAVSP
jgi:hypothetical protein